MAMMKHKSLGVVAVAILLTSGLGSLRAAPRAGADRDAARSQAEQSSSTPELWRAATTGDLEAIHQLAAAGVNLNAPLVRPGKPGSGGTPLHLAVASGQLEAAKLLLSKGADLEARAADGQQGTPLYWAAYVGRLKAVKFLLQAGAKPDAKTRDGRTPLDAAQDPTIPSREKPAIVRLLRGEASAIPPGPAVKPTRYRGAYYVNGEIHVNTYGAPEGKPVTTGHWDFKPSWSKTGDMLVFFRRMKNDPVTVNWKTAICIVNVDGTGFHQLTDGTHTDFNQTWTRDGSNTPIWNRKNSENGGFHVMASKVGNRPGQEIPLTDERYHTWAYTCLKDGRILVQCAHPVQGWGYYLMTPGKDGGKPRFERLSCELARHGLLDRISLSPSETKVCFEYQKGYRYKESGRTLYVADFDAKRRTITNAKAFANAEGSPRWFAYPRWTKDEQAIVYHASPSLYLYTLKDDTTRQVSTNPDADYRYPHCEATPK